MSSGEGGCSCNLDGSFSVDTDGNGIADIAVDRNGNQLALPANTNRTIIGPNGGHAKYTGEVTSNGQPILERVDANGNKTGGYYYNHNGKQESVGSPFPHGNSKNSTDAQHGYEIIDTDTGKSIKTGVSSTPLSVDSLTGKKVSSRATQQTKDWNEEEGYDKYEHKVVKEIPEGENARKEILEWEQENTNKLKEQLDRDKHKLPKPK